MNKCIFCLQVSDEFNTIEHIVSESLGNSDDILYKAVCDKCQNYLGKEIENYVLSKTSFGFWRTLAGTKSKRGKLPLFNATQSKKHSGKIADYHPLTDNGFVIRPQDNESIIEVEINDKVLVDKVNSGQKTNFKIVLTPKMLIYMGRFLGKIALEYWFREFGDDVFRKDFDELRDYVRKGSTRYMWPIMQGRLDENLLKYKKISNYEEKRTLYAYRFFQVEKVIIFSFDMGNERYSMLINDKYPDENIFTEQVLSAICKGTLGLPNILYYHL